MLPPPLSLFRNYCFTGSTDSLQQERPRFLAYLSRAMELAAEDKKEGAVALRSRFFDKSIASIVAAICSYIDPSYISTVAYATELNILAQTGSPTAAEFARQALCGGVAPSTSTLTSSSLWRSRPRRSCRFLPPETSS